MENTNAQRPMILAMEEAEPILVNAVNQILASGVSPYFLKMIFDKVGGELSALAKGELNAAKMSWENKIKEEKEEIKDEN